VEELYHVLVCVIDPINLLLILGVLSSIPNFVLLLPNSRTERGTPRSTYYVGAEEDGLLLQLGITAATTPPPPRVRPNCLEREREREDVRRKRKKDGGGRGRRSYLRSSITDRPTSSGPAARSAFGFVSGRHPPTGAQAHSDEAA
jgi:hypothetical protein